ncbi:hypothetical protein ACS0TY_010170 [Phlomoides rotata]
MIIVSEFGNLMRRKRVVKRPGSSLGSSFNDKYPVVGSKRPVRERLGSTVDSSAEVNNKRLRRDGGTANAFSDSHLSKHDLRYKIMQKNVLKQSQNGQQNGGDLRNILSRPAQSSSNSIAKSERMPEPRDTRPHYSEPTEGRQQFTETRMPEPRDARLRYLEPTDGRQHYTETRDGRNFLPDTRNANLPIPEFRVGRTYDPRRQHILDARDGERSMFEAKDVRRPMPDPRSSLTRMEPGINSYSPWTLDHIRKRSPDESLATSRGPTAPKKDEIYQKRFAVGSYDADRASTYMSKDAFDVARPISSSNLTKMAPPAAQLRTMAPMASLFPLSGSVGQKSSYVVDDQVTVDSFLRTLGLEKFAIIFKAEEVDMYSLKRMSERDLKELGLPMGPRKKILLSLQPRMKQQAG